MPQGSSKNSGEANLRRPFHELVASIAVKVMARDSVREGAKRAYELLKLCQHLATFLCMDGV